MEDKVKVSVRNLVEFILRCGDLDNRFSGTSRAAEGTRAHLKIQKKNKKLFEGKEKNAYNSEVFLKYEIEYKNINFIIDGRADEIFIDNSKVTINEIKTTSRNLEDINENYNIVHWAQVTCYGYIYAKQNELEKLVISLTYFNIENEETKVLSKMVSIEELEKEFLGYLEKYAYWAELAVKWKNVRNTSIKNSGFPFEKYRKGQRKLAVYVYKTIQQKRKLFVKAPTGIGKTISTLFPAVKALGEELCEKIFYLTAKGTTAMAANSAANIMRQNGVRLKTIILTSKEKICFNDEVNCNPEECTYAKGHYDRVNDAINELLDNEESYTKEIIETYAHKYRVCPFELSLDLTLWCDCIICDYNYLFDPSVCLKAFFAEGKGDYVFLVDEAHNLPDRAREMYSAELYKSKVMYLKKNISKKSVLYKNLNSINSFFIKMKKLSEDNGYVIDKEEAHDEIGKIIFKFLTKCEKWILENREHEVYKEMLEFYLDAFKFVKIYEMYSENFMFYGEKDGKDFKIKLFCLDPSKFIKESVKKGISTIFFSATLSPMSYFKEMLGSENDDYNASFDSPFPEKNKCLIVVNSVSTKYVDREKSYDAVVQYIKSFVEIKRGNYMVFFPSYKYMNEVYDRFHEVCNYETIVQKTSMNEIEKEEFLSKFKENNENGMAAFCVLGGIFSEGIDLKGKKLIGAAIIGVGLPKICIERDMIREYFDDKNNLGYEYSYMYPGMNKVLQAAGRVIRSEEDKGTIMLLDKRFANYNYRKLFPAEWKNPIYDNKNFEIEKKLHKFWADC